MMNSTQQSRFVVWIKEAGEWVEQGDGPLSKLTAERIAREIRTDCHVSARVLPAGMDPR